MNLSSQELAIFSKYNHLYIPDKYPYVKLESPVGLLDAENLKVLGWVDNGVGPFKGCFWVRKGEIW